MFDLLTKMHENGIIKPSEDAPAFYYNKPKIPYSKTRKITDK